MAISHNRILSLANAYMRLQTEFQAVHDQMEEIIRDARSGKINFPTFIEQIRLQFTFTPQRAADMGLVQRELGRYEATSARLTSEAGRQRRVRAHRANNRGADWANEQESTSGYTYTAPGEDPFGEMPTQVPPSNALIPAKTLENIAKYIEQKKEEPSRVTFEGEKLPGQGDEYRKSGLV